jgi:hypothetical protein
LKSPATPAAAITASIRSVWVIVRYVCTFRLYRRSSYNFDFDPVISVGGLHYGDDTKYSSTTIFYDDTDVCTISVWVIVRYVCTFRLYRRSSYNFDFDPVISAGGIRYDDDTQYSSTVIFYDDTESKFIEAASTQVIIFSHRLSQLTDDRIMDVVHYFESPYIVGYSNVSDECWYVNICNIDDSYGNGVVFFRYFYYGSRKWY